MIHPNNRIILRCRKRDVVPSVCSNTLQSIPDDISNRFHSDTVFLHAVSPLILDDTTVLILKLQSFLDTTRILLFVYNLVKVRNDILCRYYQIYHNYIRLHMGLGKTPSEICGIEINGDNKWLTLIQNASRKES